MSSGKAPMKLRDGLLMMTILSVMCGAVILGVKIITRNDEIER